MVLSENVLKYRRKIFDKIGFDNFVGKLVLDVGCGDGGDTWLISQQANLVMAIDNQANAAWTFKKSEKIGFQVANAINLPFGDNMFDIVFAKDALHHIEGCDIALGEMIRVTKKGGKIIILEGNRYNPISYFNMTLLRGHQHFTKRYFKKLILSKAKKVDFATVESRVWPFGSNLLLACFNLFELLISKVSALNNYNLAVVTKT